MAMWRTVGALLLILQAVLGQSNIRWCTISDGEQAKCKAMSNAFAAVSISPSLSCVSGATVEGCVQKLQKNEADALSMSSTDIFRQYSGGNFKIAGGESRADRTGATYYTVAVVKKSNPSINIFNLAGRNSCHTGKGRTAGWKMPLGYFIDQGYMSMMGCNVAQGAANFFNASCIPGANEPGDPASLCAQCAGDENGNHKCEWGNNERYFSYHGAFRCLVDGAGEVAFIKHTTVEDNTNGRGPEWAQHLKSSDYELLCRDGTRAPVDQWKTCHLVRVPSRGIVVNPKVTPSVVYKMLTDGLETSGFPMFAPGEFGKGSLLFSEYSTMFQEAAYPCPKKWLGSRYYNAMKAMECTVTETNLRWCVVSNAEQQKCADMATAFHSKQLVPDISCVFGESDIDCLDKIKNKEADAIAVGGSFIYKAGKDYGLVPATGETYTEDNEGVVYYAVAVVKKSTKDIHSISDLRGRRSCHTGVGRTAGWMVPVATLIEKGLIYPENCDVPNALGGFFEKSCIPGANQPGYPSNLCELCIGDSAGQNKCDRGKDQYYGYDGAFRCLAQGDGDVAFIKHSTVFTNTDGNSTESWAENLKSKDFQLICAQDSRAEVGQYKQCNLATVPSQAVMVRRDTNIYNIYGLLDNAQKHFGSDTGTGFKLFDSQAYSGKDLIFRDSTLRLVSVVDKKSYQAWLGPGYLDAMINMECSSSSAVMSSVWLLLVALLSSMLTTLWI